VPGDCRHSTHTPPNMITRIPRDIYDARQRDRNARHNGITDYGEVVMQMEPGNQDSKAGTLPLINAPGAAWEAARWRGYPGPPDMTQPPPKARKTPTGNTSADTHSGGLR
jgi:hypothetical protein